MLRRAPMIVARSALLSVERVKHRRRSPARRWLKAARPPRVAICASSSAIRRIVSWWSSYVACDSLGKRHLSRVARPRFLRLRPQGWVRGPSGPSRPVRILGIPSDRSPAGRARCRAASSLRPKLPTAASSHVSISGITARPSQGPSDVTEGRTVAGIAHSTDRFGRGAVGAVLPCSPCLAVARLPRIGRAGLVAIAWFGDSVACR